MAIELLIIPDRLSNKDLKEFYRKYCEVYDLGNGHRALITVEKNALTSLLEKGVYEYHHLWDAMFKIQTFKNRNCVIIYAWGDRNEKKAKKLEPKYINKLKEYFKEKEDAVPIRQIR